MEIDGILNTLTSNYIPEAVLAIGGLLAVVMTYLYLKDDESTKYRLTMIISTFFGILMAVIAFSTYGTWALPTSIIMFVAAFTLIIRPFKEIHFAVIIALLIMGVAYLLLGGLEGTNLAFMSEGLWRIGIAVFCGAIVYSLMHMLESIVKVFGKILNAWPILFVLGVICVAEAVLTTLDYGSIYNLLRTHFDI
ncbi:MAG: hypothetical protein FWD92_03665 [Methanomassiliicoccaceae archaeon]|nr:hypothetical protein [Methanomassiliicoccaceae archaeon]